MESKKILYAKTEPETMMVFYYNEQQPNQSMLCTVKLINLQEQSIAFKIKGNSVAMYQIEPGEGTIQGNNYKQIMFVMKPIQAADKKDKILTDQFKFIMSLQSTYDSNNSDAKFWSQTEKYGLQSITMRVTLSFSQPKPDPQTQSQIKQSTIQQSQLIFQSIIPENTLNMSDHDQSTMMQSVVNDQTDQNDKVEQLNLMRNQLEAKLQDLKIKEINLKQQKILLSEAIDKVKDMEKKLNELKVPSADVGKSISFIQVVLISIFFFIIGNYFL